MHCSAGAQDETWVLNGGSSTGARAQLLGIAGLPYSAPNQPSRLAQHNSVTSPALARILVLYCCSASPSNSRLWLAVGRVDCSGHAIANMVSHMHMVRAELQLAARMLGCRLPSAVPASAFAASLALLPAAGVHC